MKLLTLTGLVVALALPTGAAGQRGAVAGCDPLGNVRFICNQLAPEDLALVPGGEWLISSGMAANRAIRLINLRDKTTTAIFPTATVPIRASSPSSFAPFDVAIRIASTGVNPPSTNSSTFR